MLFRRRIRGEALAGPCTGLCASGPGRAPANALPQDGSPGVAEEGGNPGWKGRDRASEGTLGGGETMPTVFSKEPPVNTGGQEHHLSTGGVHHLARRRLGHAVPELTGDRKYADLARQCVEKLFEGQVDTDTPPTTCRPRARVSAWGRSIRESRWPMTCATTVRPRDYRKSLVERLQTIKPKKTGQGPILST